jgi:hypothetical protein
MGPSLLFAAPMSLRRVEQTRLSLPDPELDRARLVLLDALEQQFGLTPDGSNAAHLMIKTGER